ncbi:MAG: hypothetical protein CVU60_07185 [Deltaproteobacteria bacterium HGW-Deltaproteobacteria-18]|jgi:hypothetical protein|nr:MAG: hypothetical protein CVU60_07185 [Deltaproteobacteria bacterium HGW-Deltaproteobacteria-18]
MGWSEKNEAGETGHDLAPYRFRPLNIGPALAHAAQTAIQQHCDQHGKDHADHVNAREGRGIF